MTTSRSRKQEFAAWLEALGDEPCGDNGLCPIRMWRGETRTRLGENFPPAEPGWVGKMARAIDRLAGKRGGWQCIPASEALAILRRLR